MEINVNANETATLHRQISSAGGVAGHQRSEVAEREREANDPEGFRRLGPAQQAVLVDWIRAVLVPSQSIFRRNSYGMKHDFEREPDGFYIRNGAFKGAMIAAGFRPVDASELNWRFRAKPARKLDSWEKEKLRLIGRGWLVRDRWREQGYMVASRGQHRRVQEHSAACRHERRLRVLVLRGARVAEIIMDTYPADFRLTDTAAHEIAALFATLNPRGRSRSITNNCLVVIRRVPAYVAEEVAARLVRIADGCRPQEAGTCLTE